MAGHSKKDQANAQFSKLQRAEDGRKAMSEYESDSVALRAKTERLKALRLARDAAAPAAAPQQAAATMKQPGKQKKPKSATLSEWLDDQKASRRRSSK